MKNWKNYVSEAGNILKSTDAEKEYYKEKYRIKSEEEIDEAKYNRIVKNIKMSKTISILHNGQTNEYRISKNKNEKIFGNPMEQFDIYGNTLKQSTEITKNVIGDEIIITTTTTGE